MYFTETSAYEIALLPFLCEDQADKLYIWSLAVVYAALAF